MSTQEKSFWIAFSRIPTLGARQLERLQKHFSSLERAWSAPSHELARAGLMPHTLKSLLENRPRINPSEELHRIQEAHVNVFTIHDKEYPRLLKEIADPPQLLYVKGAFPALQPTVAIVGTRKATTYGNEVARELATGLSRMGICIVSGLALGVDTAAHRYTLESGGTTVAVLGSALDRIFPVANTKLAEEIPNKRGAVVSEYPLGMGAQKHHFPVRNRIIAGLSLGTIVVEGNKDSGSLITARLALEYNREVMAVPGDIVKKTSEGTNNLLKLGARPVTSAQDVLDALNIDAQNQKLDNISKVHNNQQHTHLSREESVILDVLTREPRHIDEIVKLSTLHTSIVNSTLTLMEVQGLIRHMGGMKYIRII